jgi:hypothetical protein
LKYELLCKHRQMLAAAIGGGKLGQKSHFLPKRSYKL